MPALIDGSPDLTVEVYVGGAAFTLDDPTLGQLDAGNVLGPTDDGWTDLTPYVTRAAWRIGATDPQGPTSRMTPGFASVEVLDPLRRYDPGNPAGPFRGRFVADAPARIIAVVAPGREAVHGLTVPGVASSFASSPESHRVAGRLTVVARVLPDVWTTLNQTIVADRNAAPAWQLRIGAALPGRLELIVWSGTVARVGTSTAPVPFAANEAGWVRSTYDPATGTVEHFTAPDSDTEPDAWTRLGDPVPTQGGQADPSSGRIEYGSLFDGQTAPLAGHLIACRADDDGTDFLSVSFDVAPGTRQITAGTGQIVTLNFSAAITAAIPGVPAEVHPQFLGRLQVAEWSEGFTSLEVADGLADLARYDPPEGNPVGAGETSGQRIARILREAGYRGPAALDAGTVTVQATALAQQALSELYRVSDSELGALYVNREGVLTFRDRTVWTRRTPALVGITSADAAGVLTDSTRSRSDRSTVRNIIGAAAAGLSEVTAADEDSVDRWGPSRWARKDLLLQTEGALLQWATDLVTWTARNRPGAVEQLRLWPIGAPRLWPIVTRLEPLVPFGVQLPGWEDEAPVIVGFSHSVTGTDWTVTLVLAPHPADAVAGAPWTLDDPDRGRLDAGNVTT